MFVKNSQYMFAMLLLAVSVGCGGDRPPLATARGTVTLNGGAVPGATVSFVPVEGGRAATAMTDSEGNYEINTYGDEDGAIVGDHYVAVMKVGGKGADMLEQESYSEDTDEMTGANSLSPNLGGVDGDNEETVDIEAMTDYLVPKRYMDPRNSGLRVTVPPEGSERLNLELTN